MSRTPLTEPMIEEVSQLFLALGDASRLKILKTLLEAEDPMSQGALVLATGLSQANTSKHLAQMVRAGLVIREARGNLVYFQPVMPLVGKLCELVCGHVTDRVKAAYKALN